MVVRPRSFAKTLEPAQAKAPGAPRRVLMIAAAFPPCGGPGVQRTVKFAKYLPSFGWKPTVWSADALDDLPGDESLLDDLAPEVHVHRWKTGSRVRALRRSLRDAAATGRPWSRLLAAIDWRLTAWLAHKPMPDDLVRWARTSVWPATGIMQRDGVAAIYSTFSPASNHLLALWLKRKTGLPWVADFRDLWTDDYRYMERSRTRRRAHRRLEQMMLEAADAVIGVTERQTDMLASHVPDQVHKFFTITNGFDPADFEDNGERTGPASLDGRFVLAHVGRLDRWRTSDAWFAGLRLFIRSLGADRDRFELRIVGHAGAGVREKLAATGARCVFTGYVPHGEAVREMCRAHALLLNVPDGPNAASVIPAKLFEYLASRRPVLVVGPPDGEAERIVRSCGAGEAVAFDAGAIAKALARIMSAGRAPQAECGCPADRLEAYSRRTSARNLANVLTGCTAEAAAKNASPVMAAEACPA